MNYPLSYSVAWKALLIVKLDRRRENTPIGSATVEKSESQYLLNVIGELKHIGQVNI